MEYPENVPNCSLYQVPPTLNMSWKSAEPFSHNVAKRQTNRQTQATDNDENITFAMAEGKIIISNQWYPIFIARTFLMKRKDLIILHGQYNVCWWSDNPMSLAVWKREYSRTPRLISLLLMLWFFASSGRQHQWYPLCRRINSLLLKNIDLCLQLFYGQWNLND